LKNGVKYGIIREDRKVFKKLWKR